MHYATEVRRVQINRRLGDSKERDPNCLLPATESGRHHTSRGLGADREREEATEAQFVAPWHWQAVTPNKRSVADTEEVSNRYENGQQQQILTPEAKTSH